MRRRHVEIGELEAFDTLRARSSERTSFRPDDHPQRRHVLAQRVDVAGNLSDLRFAGVVHVLEGVEHDQERHQPALERHVVDGLLRQRAELPQRRLLEPREAARTLARDGELAAPRGRHRLFQQAIDPAAQRRQRGGVAGCCASSWAQI